MEFKEEDAYRSGKQGYRIGVELYGNPFKGPLGVKWAEGWNYAKANDPYPKPKRINYAEDRSDDRRPNSRYSSSRKSRGSYSER